MTEIKETKKFLAEITIMMYPRRAIVKDLVDKIKNGEAPIVSCPNFNYAYNPICKVFFKEENSVIILEDFEFNVRTC